MIRDIAIAAISAITIWYGHEVLPNRYTTPHIHNNPITQFIVLIVHMVRVILTPISRTVGSLSQPILPAQRYHALATARDERFYYRRVGWVIPQQKARESRLRALS